MSEVLEKRIIGEILKIKAGKISKSESPAAKFLNQLKNYDEAAYLDLMERYKRL
jgi:hypothetical protein